MRRFVLMLAVLLLPALASAQTAVNPRTAEFTPSPEHNATILDTGQAFVTRYDLRIYLQGATDPFTTADVGKPTPDPDGKIRVTNPAWFVSLAMNTLYVAKVAAIGPTGEGVSAVSNPFGNVGPPSPAANVVVKR